MTDKLALMRPPLPEPLIRSGPTTRAEDRELASALARYQARAEIDDFSVLTRFLERHPHSAWRVSLLVDLGLAYKHYGYLSRALDAWEAAWREGKAASDGHLRALVDRAAGELMLLNAELGRAERATELLDEIGERPVTGAATMMAQQARELLWTMKNEPKHVFLCGPLALRALMLANTASAEALRPLTWYNAGPDGVSLADVTHLAEKVKAAYQPVFRTADQPVPVPSIVHWKTGHFAAILGEQNGRFRIQDALLGPQEHWVTLAAIAAEGSGYFLAPADKIGEAGWRPVSAAEGGQVWGRGQTNGPNPHDSGCNNNGGSGGMATPYIAELAVGIGLTDTPVGYTPTIGPSAKAVINYNRWEQDQPTVFPFFNISPQWTLNWLTYVQDDPANVGSSVERYRPGGGAYLYSGYNSTTGAFNPEDTDASVLVLASQSPVTYRRFLRDGTVETYAQSDGSTSWPRRVFMTQLIDPQGNGLTLNYSTAGGQVRLISIADATGRSTIFAYGLSSAPLLITQITDPFGRKATLNYDSSGRLSSITDVIGITSSFTYDSSSIVNSLTTPYGTTKFAYGGTGNSRFLQITDPLGNNERQELLSPAPVPYFEPVAPNMPVLNAYLNYRNSFHWDPHEYVLAGCTPKGGCNYNSARIKHFTHGPQDSSNDTQYTWHSIESIKEPLETRIWFDYPGQTNGQNNIAGTYDQPTMIGRVVDGHTTKLTQRSYNQAGNPTQLIDPAGRTTNLSYAANQLDLLQVQQVTQSGAQTLAAYTYNSRHRPLTYTDAAGQVTQYAYNAAGQPSQVTLPTGLIWSFAYDSLGRLTQLTNPNGATQRSYTYDGFDRVATVIDSEGYTLSYSYDALDRVTQIAYPDGTTRSYSYNRLDLTSVTDRQSRTTIFAYDADRRLISETDPLGNKTTFAYWENGAPQSLSDPNGNVTRWNIDLQGRVAGKQYADGSKVTYGYDSSGRMNAIRDALGQIKQYTHTVDNRLARIDYTYAVNPTPSVSFSYDADFLRVASITDGTGATSYAYVPVGSLGALKLQSENGPTGTISYQYDALGRVTGRTVSGVADGIQFDSLDRAITHTDPLGQFAMTYLGQTGQITGRSQTSGQNYPAQTAWSYLANSGDRRLAAIANSGMRQFQFTTTPENLITGITVQSQTGSVNWSYGYDAGDRLTNASNSNGFQYSMTLDSDGNLTQLTSNSGQTQFLYNGLNQLVGGSTNIANRQPHNPSVGYQYDANGNLLSDGQRSYSWDAENRLIAISYAGQTGHQTLFAYDGVSRRVAITETVPGKQPMPIVYQWCGSRICQQKSSGGIALRLYYGEGEALPVNETQLYYGPDQLGSPRNFAAITTSGILRTTQEARVARESSAIPVSAPLTTTTIQGYDFDPFGNQLAGPGGAPTPDFRFAGMFYHAPSGLYLTQYRAYDPRINRWLSRDPIGERGSPNLYVYASNSPVNRIDVRGLSDCGCENGAGQPGQPRPPGPPPPGPPGGGPFAAAFQAALQEGANPDNIYNMLKASTWLEGGDALEPWAKGLGIGASLLGALHDAWESIEAKNQEQEFEQWMNDYMNWQDIQHGIPPQWGVYSVQ